MGGPKSSVMSQMQRTETAGTLFNLTDQIEACVWDNIKLTHINAKLLEYAKKQAQEVEKTR